ncbi:SGNH/GDSL hydrolase family protein [Homoserinibacter sp. YIM 151385]|uniref:SGNH/GDSL hydrolase family protein n=1 Tax=Homoserinibacter sp. YIM 151385 TaxID=2985506 RepID=UPI0022F04840|nr:SGNH/GDSL hydrolase family protein [Homoserinibacter sp. YIM 151385]WBU37375.1 SGNH/GDSL hydrolase family protein [Homoserinibacter sp. YIM 151385]
MSRAPAILLSPVVLAQARRLRREVPHLDPPPPPWTGATVGGALQPEARRLVVLGDSTAVGTGVERAEDALAPRVAAILADTGIDDGRGVVWTAVGEHGATADRIRGAHLGDAVAERPHVAVIAAGWNDAMHLRSPRAYAGDLREMVRELRDARHGCRIVLLAPPRFGAFPGLPQPLRRALGRASEGLVRAAARVAREERTALARGFDGASTAADGFHPDAAGYAALADGIRRALRSR